VRSKSALFLIILAFAIPAVAQRSSISDGVFTSVQALRGKSAFDMNCSRCHNLALTGSERGPAIKGPAFLFHWDKDNLAGLFTKIRDTMPQGNSGTVKDEVKIDILSYILQQNGFSDGSSELKSDISSLEDIRVARKGIWDGIFTTAQADRGKAALSQNGCNGCHGAELAGDRGPALKGDAFTTDWENGSVNRLFTKIRETMPPANAEQVPPEVKLDIVAYLLQVNGFPSGTTVLKLNDLDSLQIVKRGAEASGPPNFSLVQVIGCLTRAQNSKWILTNASDPVATKEEDSTPAALEAARSKPLGAQVLELVSVSPSLKADSRKNQKVEVRGLLYRDPKYAEVNLTSLQTVASSCTN
jgi:S-disulfanyl-L-cysteine oxidoreductase SoxD